MKREPARLLDSANLPALERRVLEAGRAACVDFDVAAGAERLRQTIHAGGPALANAAVHSSTAAMSLKLVCLLASAAGLGAAYYAFSEQSSTSRFESPDVRMPQESVESNLHPTNPEAAHISSEHANENANTQALAAPEPRPLLGTSSARVPVHPRDSAAGRKRRASSQPSESRPARPERDPMAAAVTQGSEPAATSALPATSAIRAVDPGSSAPLVMAELRDVARARALLQRDPGEALVLLEHLRVTHPHGFLLEERAALTVLALAATGQRDHAERRALEFLRRTPESPFADRVRSAVQR